MPAPALFVELWSWRKAISGSLVNCYTTLGLLVPAAVIRKTVTVTKNRFTDSQIHHAACFPLAVLTAN